MIGAGMMGAQIGIEYALAGHQVCFVARDAQRVSDRVRWAARFAEEHHIAAPLELAGAAERSRVSASLSEALEDEFDLVVESVAEDLDTKAALLGLAARMLPNAIMASNASSLSIGELGHAIGAPDRTIGTHYWNPPLLMPPVEVVVTPELDRQVLRTVETVLQSLGKEVVLVEREVPGFIWNRLQMAVLREALWLIEHGVAAPETIDLVIRSGYARRSRYTGPFETVVLGGIDSWERAAANIFPALSTEDHPGDMRRHLNALQPAETEAAASRRDRGLAAELRRERTP